jgi:uncharacterized membrane protein YccC
MNSSTALLIQALASLIALAAGVGVLLRTRSTPRRKLARVPVRCRRRR